MQLNRSVRRCTDTVSRRGVGFGTAVWLIKQNNYMNKINDSTRHAPLQTPTSWSQITPLEVTEQYEVTQLTTDVNPYQQAPKIIGSLFEAWLRQKPHCQVPRHFTPFCRHFLKALLLSSDTPQLCQYYFCDKADVSDKEELNPLATKDNSNLDNTVQYILFRTIIRRPSSHVLAHW